ncbi:MAG: hypothetical protein M0R03_17165 [Novosphingobium sp.]|nr:hypothetical protein [Novosphingobium sp.]
MKEYSFEEFIDNLGEHQKWRMKNGRHIITFNHPYYAGSELIGNEIWYKIYNAEWENSDLIGYDYTRVNRSHFPVKLICGKLPERKKIVIDKLSIIGKIMKWLI